MTLPEFKASVASSGTPVVTAPLTALWHDARGDWEEAHAIVQEMDHPDGAWVHAYLHRKEGDAHNAKFWYDMAGRKFPLGSLESEWDEIASYFLGR